MLTTKTIPVTIEKTIHECACELCPSAWEVSDDDAQVMILPDREPTIRIIHEGGEVLLYDLCDGCAAFVRDGLDRLLTPISRARRYGTQAAPQDPQAAAVDEDAGGDGDGAEEDR